MRLDGSITLEPEGAGYSRCSGIQENGRLPLGGGGRIVNKVNNFV